MGPLLEVRNAVKSYTRGKLKIQAVRGVSFRIEKGECLGLVGESGCGKSTIAKLIAGLETVDAGKILMEGDDITDAAERRLRNLRQAVQMVFQAPAESFNPKLKIAEGIMEGLINQGRPRREARKLAEEGMETCGLPRELADRYPYQLSGGECQRASLARAIVVKPKLLICDEATSSLDVTIQARIIELLGRLKKELNTSYLFISHDIALVQEICDRALVMKQGSVIEEGTPDEIILNPTGDCTISLINAVPEIG